MVEPMVCRGSCCAEYSDVVNPKSIPGGSGGPRAPLAMKKNRDENGYRKDKTRFSRPVPVYLVSERRSESYAGTGCCGAREADGGNPRAGAIAYRLP